MAHYAILDGEGYVATVIVGKDENEIVLDENGNPYDWETYYGGKRTSYNTIAGEHSQGGTPFRKNYAGPGYFYDSQRDAFIPPKLYPSWIFDEETCVFKPPVSLPDETKSWYWDELTKNWREAK